MRAMLTCRDTQGRLRGLSPGAGSGSELAEPPHCPGEPLGGAELQAQLPRAPAHPPRAAHLHGPQRRFSVHPKDVRPAKETQSGSELWPSCQCPYPPPNANPRPSLGQELLFPTAVCPSSLCTGNKPFPRVQPQALINGFGSGMLLHIPRAAPRARNGLRQLPAAATSIPAFPHPGRADPKRWSSSPLTSLCWWTG